MTASFNHSNFDNAETAAMRFWLLTGKGGGNDRVALIMDLVAADGVNGNAPLDWSRLLRSDDFDFLHDVGGIRRHMNRDTGKLASCFVPRHTLVAA